ncbi:MAG TPA: hypothetical protein PKM63_19095 [Panacibacter sp.]|nr:hypothetical protein [Panacibacter sp.]HNP46409.1 hypothetical protein [Panacibacter sp.]
MKPIVTKQGAILQLFITVLIFFSCTTVASAQKAEQEEFYRHRFSVMMANVHIPNMDGVEGQNKFSVVPAWGFDYDFWFNKRWAVGLHNDLILQQYKIVKEENHTVVERSYPISMCVTGIYKPFEHLSFVGGLGKEFEKNESFGMCKLGLEYGFELRKAWELSLNLQYDNKFKAYDSWLFGIGISKRVR